MSVSIDIVDRIAATLLIAAEKEKCQSDVKKQLLIFQKALQNESIGRLFAVRVLPRRYKQAMVKILQKLGLHDILYRFLNFLVIKRNLGYIVPQIVDRYFAVMKKRQGIMTIQIRFAGELTDSVRKQILTQLNAQNTKTVEVEFVRDDRLLYGMQIFSDGYVLDFSAKMKLLKLQSAIDAAALKTIN